MSCRRAHETDLTAFAADRMSSEWAEFRDHYPRCPECSRAVARLATLEAAIRGEDVPGPAHLDEDEVLALAEGRLEEGRAERLEAHLARCPACRTELAVLRSFAPAAAFSAADTTAPDPAPARRSPLELLRALFGGGLAPGPRWAWAAAVAVGLLLVWSVSVRDGGPTPPRVARNAPEPVAPDTREPLGAPAPREQTLAADRPAPVPEALEGPAAGGAEEGGGGAAPPPATERLAARPPDAAPSRPAEARTPPRKAVEHPEALGRGETGEPVVIAALLPSELPRYRVPSGFTPHDLERIRVGGGLRGTRPAGRISVLAPEHAGLTKQASPTLYWALAERSDAPVEIVVSDPSRIEPVLEKRVPAPVGAGIHGLDLAQEGIELALGRTYGWSVSLVPDEARREADVVSLAAIRRVAETSAPPRPATPAERAREIHRLAEGGSWYDAFDRLSRWIAKAPEVSRLRDYRRSLLAQVGLEPVDTWLDPGPRDGAGQIGTDDSEDRADPGGSEGGSDGV